MTHVVLVNEKDEAIGTMEKLEAHQKGKLHRAFSIFIYNSKGDMLLQQRSSSKYHNAGMWTNACCSHPLPGEKIEMAAARRLQEELGFSTPLIKLFNFTYKADFDNGLTEHEFDHVFIGTYDGPIVPEPEEVMDIKHISPENLKWDVDNKPGMYTEWFKIALPKIETFGSLVLNS